MITNLLRPWILARLLSGGAVLALGLFGAWVAWRVLRHWRVGATNEGQLALERRAELVAAVVQVALGVAVTNLALTVLAADRLTHSIRGAMCAWGVFDASPWGFRALATAAAAAAGCAFWVVLHRLDLRTRRPTLTRRKFTALFAVVPLLGLDLFATTRWALDLDMQVVASCCSVGLDDALGSGGAAGAGPHVYAGWVALFTALGAAAASLYAWRRPGRFAAWLAAGLSAVAAAAALPAILWVVAPHAYETPHHLCPFCLLHADTWGLGWPLFGGLFAAAICGTAVGLVESQRRASGEPEAALALERRLGGWAAAAWMLTVLVAAVPVVRYAMVTGGASLFGGS
ncbi:MAG TPA: hypothetical protein RMH99_16315 [Sandaracinaceae bacterium LLY-WYZ-13_1]|nr:hypothetical protein [Sandaracinaceae bacterium LLY-WYZ-13_1]